jgi:glycine betaine/proline transport system substrate-binding protein
MRTMWKGAVAAGALMASATLALPAMAQSEECGTDRTIDIAEMTWTSAAALAHIHAIVLEDGFGCNVDIVTGDTVPTSASMLARGTPAVAPELWTSAIEDAWAEGIEEGVVVQLADAITDGTVEGWFIPAYTKEEHPEIETVEDVLARPDLFADPENPGMGRIYACPPGWACELANAALFEALDIADEWNLFSPGSGGNLDASIARAFLQEQPILFYYWGPTAILGRYDTFQIDIGEVDEEIYACNTDSACDEPARVTAWPSSPAVVGAASWIPEEAPNVAAYFENVGLTSQEISELLVYGDENMAGARETAENFLATREDIWTQWVSDDVAERVRASL